MANNSISPVSRTSTFQHPAPSAAAPPPRVLDTSTPAINAQPVELDGMPTTPEELRRRATAGSTGVGSSSGPADGEDIDAEFLGEGAKGAGQIGREKRAAILASRSKDPGVIVDVPREPTAEEVEAAKSGDGMITPGLDAPRLPVLSGETR
jgi:hypothetical protein